MKVEKFNCRFSDFEYMVENGSISKSNLISITPIDADLCTVIIWVEQE
tara:strand:+ start:43 stop:186 length:144 start_codon:yes stop_codon:yes gene_type:complete